MNLSSDLLPSEEVLALIRKYKKDGDLESRDKVVFCNMRMVYNLAHRYKQSAVMNGYDFEDIVSDGVMGLIEAVDKFDESYGVKFLTYAYWWVLKKISTNISAGILVLPYHRRRAAKDFEKLQDEARDAGKEFDVDQACKDIGVSKKTILDTMSKKESIYDNGLADALSRVTTGERIEDQIIDGLLYEKVRHIIDHDLEKDERTVIIDRFGLDGFDPKTLDGIAKDLDISFEYVRIIQNRTLKKLSKIINKKKNVKIRSIS